MRLIIILAGLLTLWPFQAQAWESYILKSRRAYVASLEDGNILMVSKWRGTVSPDTAVLFYGIGIPTMHQPFGPQARELLLKLLPRGRQVSLESASVEKDGQLAALVQAGGVSVNHRLLADGLAWVDRGKCRAFFCRRWLIQENVARKERRGIWSINVSTPPWQWGEMRQ